MENVVEPAPGILTVSLFDASTCARVIEHANALSWHQATVQNRRRQPFLKPDFRSSKINFFDKGTEIRRLFRDRVSAVVRPLVRTRWRQDYPDHSGVQIVRYEPGDFFGAHRDSGAYGSGIEHRYFSVVCYLNDDFEGGGTSFPEVNYTAPPERGKAVIFPADYLHRGDVVEEGVKYIGVTWLLGAPPIHWI